MKRFDHAIITLILLFTAHLCIASERLVSIPYDPKTDLSKLAGDLAVSEGTIEAHSRCAYIHLSEWAATAKLQSLGTCVVLLTADQLILATWQTDSGTYIPVFKFPFTEISSESLSVEGVKYQLQLTTPTGFLAITTSKYRSPPPGDSSESSEIFKLLNAKGVAMKDSLGRVDLEKSPGYILVPIKRR